MRTRPTSRRSRQTWYGENGEKENAIFQEEVKEQETAERNIDDLSAGEPSVVTILRWRNRHGQRVRRSEMQEEPKIAAPESVSATSAGATSEDGTKDADESGRDADLTSDDDASLASSGVGTEDGWDVSDLTMDDSNNEALELERRQRHMLMERSAEELECPDEVDGRSDSNFAVNAPQQFL